MTQPEITELKDFFLKTLTNALEQQSVELRVEIEQVSQKVDQVHDKLDAKIDLLASFSTETIENYYHDHERRIVRLESRKA